MFSVRRYSPHAVYKGRYAKVINPFEIRETIDMIDKGKP